MINRILCASLSIAFVLPLSASLAQATPDWANLGKYRDENVRLAAAAPAKGRVVFFGNSIIESWGKFFPAMFPGKNYVNRGIDGQTTPQMLVRFRQDVVALKPKVVVILAGTNDIAGNTGPSTLEMIEDNIRSMTEIARANHIRVVLCSVLPALSYKWKPDLRPAQTIVALNAWLRSYASQIGARYVDFHSAMRDSADGLRVELGLNSVHPNEAGYRVMAPLVERAIAQAMRRP